MLRKLEGYRFEGEMYQTALHELPKNTSLSTAEKQKLKKAYKQGW